MILQFLLPCLTPIIEIPGVNCVYFSVEGVCFSLELSRYPEVVRNDAPRRHEREDVLLSKPFSSFRHANTELLRKLILLFADTQFVEPLSLI